MKAGGYLFDAKSDATATRALSTSMAKNTTTFHKLPNDDFGLLEWYPNIPKRTRTNGKDEEAEKEEESQADKQEPKEQQKDGLAVPYEGKDKGAALIILTFVRIISAAPFFPTTQRLANFILTTI
jgi:hypothetical protein